jgi:hypothetical protein
MTITQGRPTRTLPDSLVTGERPSTGPLRRRADGPPALLVDRVSKRFVLGRRKKTVSAVDDVSLRVERGEVYGLLGAGPLSELLDLLWPLLIMAVVFIHLGLWTFGRAERHAKRTGRLKRVG